jgi:DNA-binding MarR family transcriptional regulator
MSASERKDTSPPGSSGSESGLLISQAHHLSGRIFARILKKHGISEFNPSLGRIIFTLWKEDGITQTQLAERTKLDKSGLALSLGKLESSGLIIRKKDKKDSRVQKVHLSGQSRKMRISYRNASDEMLSLFFGDIPSREIAQFERTLRKIIENLEKSEKNRER